jgi:hypothetical protein
MRKWATAVVTAGLFFGGMGAAVADSWHDWRMSTAGASFIGEYKWKPKDQPPSGLLVRGQLRDESNGDGHNVYLEVGIAEYPKYRIKGVQKKAVNVDKHLHDPALIVTRDVDVQLCRDRGSFRPDNCDRLRKFTRK